MNLTEKYTNSNYKTKMMLNMIEKHLSNGLDQFIGQVYSEHQSQEIAYFMNRIISSIHIPEIYIMPGGE